MGHFDVRDERTIALYAGHNIVLATALIIEPCFVTITGQQGVLLRGCNDKLYIVQVARHPSSDREFFAVIECDENGIHISNELITHGRCVMTAAVNLLRFLWSEELHAIQVASIYN